MKEKLNILWVNDNPETAHTMVFMYATNAKKNGWWDEVEIIVWGASSKLLAQDETIQERLKMAVFAGVKVRACIACAKMFGVVDKLKQLGIEPEPMGIPLTEILKEGEKLITI